MSNKLVAALRNRAATITAELEDSKLFEHHGERGAFREGIIKRFLRPFLPECYGLASGEAFDLNGQSSRQLDVVIHDPIFSTVLFRDRNDSWLFPCESVYGNIEIKSHLTGDELRTSFQNVASLKQLHRETTTMLDFLPTVRLGLDGGLAADPTPRNPYLGVVFGYDGVSVEHALAVINQDLAGGAISKDHAPEAVFVYKQGYALFKGMNNGTIARFGQPYDGYRWMRLGEDTMPLFYLTLLVCLQNIRLKAPDMNAYWQKVLCEAAARQE